MAFICIGRSPQPLVVYILECSVKYELHIGHIPQNNDITEKDIADVISYVTNEFSDIPKGLKTEKVAKLRATKSKSSKEYTEEELLHYSKLRGNQSSKIPLFR